MTSHPPKPNALLTRIRIAYGLSQQDLAERLNVSLKQVWRWENGIAQPRYHSRLLLCSLFHSTAEELGLGPAYPALALPGGVDEKVFALPHLLPPLSPRVLAGRDQDLAALRRVLLEGISLIITGMAGIGKTTLAITLAHDPAIRRYFQDCILWATVGRHPNVPEIIQTWGQLLGISPDHLAAQGKAALQAAIGNRPMCFVLDDVWNSTDARHLHVGGSHCVSVYTSRFPRVAAELSGGTCLSYPLRELNEEQSVSLLRLFAPQAIAMEPEMARALVRAVDGLPLALTLVGRALNLQSATGQARRVRAAFERLRNAEERLRLPVEPLSSALVQPGSTASLASVIATSEEMLDEQAQTALYALSVLPATPASFSEAAALATARCTVEILDLLCDLGFLECSAPTGYRMHRVIADYARTQLDMASREAAFSSLTSYVQELLKTSADDDSRLNEEKQTIQTAFEAAAARNSSFEASPTADERA